MILAFETGRQLRTRAIFAEEVRGDDGVVRREFRRGFTIAPGERVILVDDILTTGGSLLAMIPAVEAAGGEIVDCHVLVDRSGGTNTLASPATGRVYPLSALWVLDLPTCEPGDGDLPALRRGRTDRDARQHRRRRPARVIRRAAARGASRGSSSAIGLLIALALVVGACGGAAETPPGAAFTPPPRTSSSAEPSASEDVPESPIAGIVTAVDSAGLSDVKGFTPAHSRRRGPDVRARHARKRRPSSRPAT